MVRTDIIKVIDSLKSAVKSLDFNDTYTADDLYIDIESAAKRLTDILDDLDTDIPAADSESAPVRRSDYYRYMRRRHIRRKTNILKNTGRGENFVKHKGMLSKGKVHCSCSLCRHESPDKQQLIANERAKQQLREYKNGSTDEN